MATWIIILFAILVILVTIGLIYYEFKSSKFIYFQLTPSSKTDQPDSQAKLLGVDIAGKDDIDKLSKVGKLIPGIYRWPHDQLINSVATSFVLLITANGKDYQLTPYRQQIMDMPVYKTTTEPNADLIAKKIPTTPPVGIAVKITI